MAREISRIEPMLDEFRKLWEKYPDLRFGQLVCNIVPENQLFYVEDTCHEEWNCILDKMIFLWREAEKDTCSQKNPFDEAHSKAMDEFTERFGLFGNKLQTEKELEENRKRGGGGTIHFMDELPEYKEISDKYREEEKRLEEYRRKCKDEAIDMLKQYFYGSRKNTYQ